MDWRLDEHKIGLTGYSNWSDRYARHKLEKIQISNRDSKREIIFTPRISRDKSWSFNTISSPLCQQSSKKKKNGVHRSFMPWLLVIIRGGVVMRYIPMRSWSDVKRWVQEWRHSSVSKGGVRTTRHTGNSITKDVGRYSVAHARS
jgi:hypothetical protein